MKGIKDFQADGTISFFSNGSPQGSLPVSMVRMGDKHVQRLIKYPNGERRQGTDGMQTWDSLGNQWSVAKGPSLDFFETHTVRGLPNLFEYQNVGSKLRDEGIRGIDRLISIEEGNGRVTSYLIDGLNSRVKRIEFVTGQAGDMFGSRRMPVVESYVFSDFRVVQGIWTPYRVEHYTNALKVDEMNFTSIRYNSNVKNDTFHQ